MHDDDTRRDSASQERRYPWFKFSPKAWRGDDGLRMCSPVARCLWLEMLCVMHAAEPRGYLLIAGGTPKNAELAKLAAMTTDQVRDGLAELRRYGVLETDEKSRIFSRKMVRESARSQVNSQNALSRWSAESSEENHDDDANRNANSMRGRIPTRTPEQDSEVKNTDKREDSAFLEFWLAYPKRVAKGAALKAWNSAIKRADPKIIIAGARNYAAEAPDPKFTKHPATWLNAGCWDDHGPTAGGGEVVEFDPLEKARDRFDRIHHANTIERAALEYFTYGRWDAERFGCPPPLAPGSLVSVRLATRWRDECRQAATRSQLRN